MFFSAWHASGPCCQYQTGINLRWQGLSSLSIGALSAARKQINFYNGYNFMGKGIQRYEKKWNYVRLVGHICQEISRITKDETHGGLKTWIKSIQNMDVNICIVLQVSSAPKLNFPSEWATVVESLYIMFSNKNIPLQNLPNITKLLQVEN